MLFICALTPLSRLFVSPRRCKEKLGPAGYLVAYRLAEENCRIGTTVVADSVNPFNMTRDASALR